LTVHENYYIVSDKNKEIMKPWKQKCAVNSQLAEQLTRCITKLWNLEIKPWGNFKIPSARFTNSFWY